MKETTPFDILTHGQEAKCCSDIQINMLIFKVSKGHSLSIHSLHRSKFHVAEWSVLILNHVLGWNPTTGGIQFMTVWDSGTEPFIITPLLSQYDFNNVKET